MAIAFQSLLVRSPRRVRVTFSGALSMGAYDVTWFSIVCTNSFGADPPLDAALLVTTDPTSVELALGVDLAPSGVYELAVAAGVPGTDASTAPAATSPFTVNAPPQDPSERISIDDLSGRVFRVDVHHDGSVMVETAAGDLATAVGPLNVKDAVVRRLISEGLPHNNGYGAHARDSVDAPGVTLPALSGRMQEQARQDPRVISATISVMPDDNDGTFVLQGQIELIGGSKISVKESL